MNIHPSQRVADQLDAQDPDFQEVSKVVSDAAAYIQLMEEENLRHLEARGEPKLDSKETYKFLRCQERTHNTRVILQYLITFISHLPLKKDLGGKPVNPFQQLKAFTLYSIDLIKEKDVTSAILREHERLGLLNETNIWYYRGQIDKSYRDLREAVEEAKIASLDDYRKLFLGLQRLATFWFSVRNQDINRVRKSDILMYKLTRALLAQYKIED